MGKLLEIVTKIRPTLINVAITMDRSPFVRRCRPIKCQTSTSG